MSVVSTSIPPEIIAPAPAAPMPQATGSSPAAPPPRPFKLVLMLLVASGILCLIAYLALAVPGSWFGKADAMHWGLKDLSVSRGTAQPVTEGWLVVAPDASGTVIVAINTSIRSTDYPGIAWDAGDIPETVTAALLWRNDYEPGRVFSQPLVVDGGQLLAVSLTHNAGWVGKISGLALIIRGTFPHPVQVRGATAKPMSAAEVLADRVREWFTFEGWSGTSINTITGGADVQELPLPFLLGTIVALASIFYVAFARWRPRYGGALRFSILGGLFIAAWLLLDARWQLNLLQQTRITASQYAGKSWSERHLAAEDGPLFAFIEKVRAKLPPPPARVFIAADAHYFRDRSAYHLYPYNVYFDPTQNLMPPASGIKSGDYLVVYQRKGVQYDASQRLLRWDGGTPIPADLLVTDAGAALFQIR
jgi:hypothetical protein